MEEGVVVVVSVEVFDPSCGFSVVPKVVRQHGVGVGSVSRLGGGTENGVVVEGSPSGAAVGFPGVQSFQQPFGVACEVVVVSDKVHAGPDFGFKKLRLGSPVVVVAGFNHFDKVGKVGGFGFAVVVGWCGATPLAYQVSFGGVEEGLVEVGREESFFGFSDKDGAGPPGRRQEDRGGFEVVVVEVSEAVEEFVVGHSVWAAHLVPVGTPRDASKELQKGRVRHLGDGKKDEPELLHNNGGPGVSCGTWDRAFSKRRDGRPRCRRAAIFPWRRTRPTPTRAYCFRVAWPQRWSCYCCCCYCYCLGCWRWFGDGKATRGALLGWVA